MAYQTSIDRSVLEGILATSQNLLRMLPAQNINGAAESKSIIAAPSWSVERDIRPSFLGDQLMNFHLGHRKSPTMELDDKSTKRSRNIFFVSNQNSRRHTKTALTS